jgi:hypothetical protein
MSETFLLMKTPIRIPQDKDFQETWDIDFEPDELAQFGILKNDVDPSCRVVTIGKTHAGQFCAFWEVRSPAVPDPDVFFKRSGRVVGSKRFREWTTLLRQNPPTRSARTLTRAEAFSLIAQFYLPAEFHKDAKLRI